MYNFDWTIWAKPPECYFTAPHRQDIRYRLHHAQSILNVFRMPMRWHSRLEMAPIGSAISAGPGAPNFARGAVYVVPDAGSNILNAFLMYLECQCSGIQGLKWPQSGAQFLGRVPHIAQGAICGTLFDSWHILHIPPRSQLAKNLQVQTTV
jgi:hypothetical protein